MKRYCIKCDVEYPETHLYCGKCGEQTVKRRRQKSEVSIFDRVFSWSFSVMFFLILIILVYAVYVLRPELF